MADPPRLLVVDLASGDTIRLGAGTAAEVRVATLAYGKALHNRGHRPSGAYRQLLDVLTRAAITGQSADRNGHGAAPGHPAPHPRLMDYHATAEALGVSTRTVRRLADAGRLTRVRIGRAVRFRLDDVDRYLRDAA